MIRKAVDYWVDCMVEQGADESQKEVYAYGLECLLNEIIGDILFLVCALLLHRVWEALVWIVVFTIIRVNAGGFHMPTPASCIISGTLVGIICIVCYPFLEHRYLLTAGALIVSWLILFLTVPVTHPNRPVSEEKKKRVRKLALFISAATGLAALAMMRGFSGISALLTITMSSVSLLALAGYYLNGKGERADVHSNCGR